MATNQGNIGLMLANNESPCTVNSFASLIGQKYFNDTKCHRLTTSPDLAVLQCGDPKGDGTGGPGYQFANEYPTDQYPPDDPKLKEPVVYPRGTLAMANAGPGTNGSQFFMVYKDSQLPPNYTVFGKIQDDGLATWTRSPRAGCPGAATTGRRPPKSPSSRCCWTNRTRAAPTRRSGVATSNSESFGRYELLGMLGRGGMGQVFRAHDTATDRIVGRKRS